MSHSFIYPEKPLKLWGCPAHVNCIQSAPPLTSLLSHSWMEAQWETFTSKSALPGSSPCLMLPLANPCGLHWVITALSLLVYGVQIVCVCVCVCTAWTNLYQCVSPVTAVQNSTKGSYRDKRNQVVYSEDFLWFKKKIFLFFHFGILLFTLMLYWKPVSQLLRVYVLQDVWRSSCCLLE